MITTRHLIGVFIIFLISLSSFSQEVELPQLGTFKVEKNTIPEMQDIWKRDDYAKIYLKLNLPKVTSKNYRTPVNMISVVAKIENSKQMAKNQGLLDNIRIENYRKSDDKATFRVQSNFNADTRINSPFNVCVHGNTQRYCRICSPRTGFGNFGFGSFGHPATRSFYYP